MNEVTKCFILGFSALIPLINPPGSAFELLSIVGVADVKPYKTLAKKISINTFLFLAVAGRKLADICLPAFQPSFHPDGSVREPNQDPSCGYFAFPVLSRS